MIATEPLWYWILFALVFLVGITAAVFVIGRALLERLAIRDRKIWSRLPGGLS